MEIIHNKRWARSVDNIREYYLQAGYLISDMNKIRTKIRNLKGDDNPISTNLDNPDNYKYLLKNKESKLRRLSPYHEGLQEWIKWKIQY